jgi:hypothetical protein
MGKTSETIRFRFLISITSISKPNAGNNDDEALERILYGIPQNP